MSELNPGVAPLETQHSKRFFLDTEFIESGPKRPIELLSVGIVCEDGREFYAANADANLTNANPWVMENVVPHLGKPHQHMGFDSIRRNILDFVGDCKPEFWGYYADYDWVVFCQIFGTMMDLPKGWPMYCRDIKQLCADKGDPKLPEQQSAEHHALHDARWNVDVYKFLKLGTTAQTGTLADVLVGCAGLLDTIKGEWGESWSVWDQSIRDGITRHLQILYAGTAQTATPSPTPDIEVLIQVADYLNQLGGGPMEDRLRLLYENLQAGTATPVETASQTFEEWFDRNCLTADQTTKEAMKTAWQDGRADLRSRLESQITQVRAELARLSADFQSWLKRYESGELDSEELTQVREELRQERSIKEAEKKILITEIETSTCLRSELEEVKKDALNKRRRAIEYLGELSKAQEEIKRLKGDVSDDPV